MTTRHFIANSNGSLNCIPLSNRFLHWNASQLYTDVRQEKKTKMPVLDYKTYSFSSLFFGSFFCWQKCEYRFRSPKTVMSGIYKRQKKKSNWRGTCQNLLILYHYLIEETIYRFEYGPQVDSMGRQRCAVVR